MTLLRQVTEGLEERSPGRFLRNGPARNLYEVISRGRTLAATDPRDKVWALVGLTGVSTLYGSQILNYDPCQQIHIDYSKPLAQVYAETTKYLWFSLYEMLLDWRYEREDLPSWGMNFHRVYNQSARFSDQKRSEVFNIPPEVTKFSDWRCLTLTGWKVSTIKVVNHGDQSTPTEYQTRMNSHLFPWMQYHGAIDSRYVNALHTQCLKKWIREVAGPRLLRAQLTQEMARGIFPQNTFYGFSFNRGNIPDDQIDQHLNKMHPWLAFGSIKPEDLIVQPRLSAVPIILRKTSDTSYMYIGVARTLYEHRFTAQDPSESTPEDRPRVEKVFWQYWTGDLPEESPYCSDFPVPKTTSERLHEDEEIFYIY